MGIGRQPSSQSGPRRRRSPVRPVERLETRDLLTLVVNNVNTTEGQPFAGLVAMFNKGDIQGTIPTDFVATIDWGDGHATTGNIVAAGSGFNVFGSNTYLSPTLPSTPETITVNVTGLNSSSMKALGSAFVLTAPLTSQGANISPSKGAPFTLPVATFQDDNHFLRGLKEANSPVSFSTSLGSR
jgi:hypothetical protein